MRIHIREVEPGLIRYMKCNKLVVLNGGGVCLVIIVIVVDEWSVVLSSFKYMSLCFFWMLR